MRTKNNFLNFFSYLNVLIYFLSFFCSYAVELMQ